MKSSSFYYNPTVFGKDNIPKQGSFILCGNQSNSVDSKIISKIVRKKIYWLDDKSRIKDKISMLQLLHDGGSIGIHPSPFVNTYYQLLQKIQELKTKIRNILHDKNTRTSDKMTEIFYIDKEIKKLNCDLEIIKKALSEKQIKDCFNYESVAIAQTTNTPIVPFAITGSYKFRSKDLIVTFGEPLKVKDNLNEANETLASTVKKLILR